jgi:exonuclease SbcC
MITSVELRDFLSHSDTKLDFEEGVTVFVGPNGAGKSSIMDAITFALFGKHTRKSNKGLIRRGTNQGYSKIRFSISGNDFEAIRKIDTKGNLSSQFSEKKEGNWIPIAAGERKQFGESMTKEIEKRIGLDFEKLKIASFVQQGELNSIIKAKPKEFKELLNSVIGIDKLDFASGLMKIIQKKFREKIQSDIGYDDTHITILKNNLQKIENEFRDAKPRMETLLNKKKKYEAELSKLRDEIESESPKIDKINQLETRKTELKKYAFEKIRSIKKEITEKERKISDCEGCFDFLQRKASVEDHFNKVDLNLEKTKEKIQELTLKVVSLKEQLSVAEKLQLKDHKCPVCDSKVDHLNPLFQKEHLKKELETISKKIIFLEKEKNDFNEKKVEFSEKLQRVKEAETTLRVHSIQNLEELIKIKKEISRQKNDIEKIPLTINGGELIEVASIDSHAKILYNTILELEKHTKGFEPTAFYELKKKLEQKQKELSIIEQQFGAVIQKIQNDESEIKKITKVLNELKIVKEYLFELERIQENVFHRDGPVATSLRSWALNTISIKTSDYLDMLNTKIQRIALSEKTREISITCFSGNSILDLESLSGGEQVSVALALRLGMAHLLGSSNLNFVILDEPTTHLDEERRKSLVMVLSQLSNVLNANSPMQFIIITHDSEIFENSAVEKIYKFESTNQGTKVTRL